MKQERLEAQITSLRRPYTRPVPLGDEESAALRPHRQWHWIR